MRLPMPGELLRCRRLRKRRTGGFTLGLLYWERCPCLPATYSAAGTDERWAAGRRTPCPAPTPEASRSAAGQGSTGGLVTQNAASYTAANPPDPIHSRWVAIEPPRRREALDLREPWAFRELLYFLTWREIKVRYKQTAIGAAWAVIQPLLTMIVFTLVFGTLMRVPSDGFPYPVFVYTALLPWNFFSSAVTRAGASLVSDAALVTKVYFPRVLLPLSAVLSTALDFVVAFVLLLALMAWSGLVPGVPVLALPFFLLLAFATALGCGLWLSALNVSYRDIAQVTPLLMQVWLFLTPVAYSSSLVPSRWRGVYGLNPMVGVVEGFRWSLLGGPPVSFLTLALSTGVALALLVSGAICFRRLEHGFADVV